MPAVYNSFLEQARKNYASAKAKETEASEKIFAEQEKVVNDTYNKAVKDTKISYEDRHRENAIQKLINQNEIAEDMANMGLSDSGLNRTQQTAVQLSYANNKSSIDRQKQAQLDSFAQSLAAELSTIKQNKISALASIDEKYENAAVSSAQEAYKTYQDAQTARVKSYYSSNSGSQGNNGDDFLLTWTGATKVNDSGETIHIYTDSKGKKHEAKVGYNPYTGSNNNKIYAEEFKEYGVHDNGYQPKGLIGEGKFTKMTVGNQVAQFLVKGRYQNIWRASESGNYFLWNGATNQYEQISDATIKGIKEKYTA